MSDAATILALRRDPINAERQRRFRERRKQAAAVTVERQTVTVSTADMRALVDRLPRRTA